MESLRRRQDSMRPSKTWSFGPICGMRPARSAIGEAISATTTPRRQEPRNFPLLSVREQARQTEAELNDDGRSRLEARSLERNRGRREAMRTNGQGLEARKAVRAGTSAMTGRRATRTIYQGQRSHLIRINRP